MHFRPLSLAIVAPFLLAASRGFGSETIGPYTIISAPISATLTSGGGAQFNWLNVVNAPVSISDAFTGFSMIADGYANAQSGTTIVVTFASGVLHNGPGTDLILFDADNDVNTYRIATSYNNFTSETILTAQDFVDTGVDRSYYYGGAGPTTYNITAAEIDLSSMGVPAGATVGQVRLFTEGPSDDPLGLATVQAAVPTLSEWGLAVMLLLLLAAGAMIILRRTRSARIVSYTNSSI